MNEATITSNRSLGATSSISILTSRLSESRLPLQSARAQLGLVGVGLGGFVAGVADAAAGKSVMIVARMATVGLLYRLARPERVGALSPGHPSW